MREYDRIQHNEFEVEFDNRNLAPIEEMGIGSTPLGFKSIAEVSESIKDDPEKLFIPTFLMSGARSIEQVEQARKRKRGLSTTSLFKPEFTIRLWKQGLKPSIVFGPLDSSGKVQDLRVGLEDPISGNYVSFSDSDLEKYSKEIREDLLEILTPSSVQEGFMVFKSNLRKEEEDAA